MRLVRPHRDSELVQIVDAALADSTRRSGSWLVCRPGCSQCCLSPFPISQLDAIRLRHGLSALRQTDPQRAERIIQRARASMGRLASGFPGNLATGILRDGTEDEVDRFSDFGGDEPCPALDPESQTCDLYAWRPMTCRTFGPPVRTGPEGALGVCELCFHGASDEQIAGCEMHFGTDALESQLNQEAEQMIGRSGETIVAFCLAEFSE